MRACVRVVCVCVGGASQRRELLALNYRSHKCPFAIPTGHPAFQENFLFFFPSMALSLGYNLALSEWRSRREHLGSGCLLFPTARPLSLHKTAPAPHGTGQVVIEVGTRGPELRPDLFPSLSSTPDRTSSAPGCHYPPPRAQHLPLPHRLRVCSSSGSSASLSTLASPWLGSVLQAALQPPLLSPRTPVADALSSSSLER